METEIVEPVSSKSIGSSEKASMGVIVFMGACNTAEVAEMNNGIARKFYKLIKLNP